MGGLGETGGMEVKEEGDTGTIFYRPSGVILKSQKGGMGDLGMRGNMISGLKGGRRELKVREAGPAKGITRLMDGPTGRVDKSGKEREAEK